MKLGLNGALTVLSEWLSRLILTTLLWALFTCIGGLVFGIMPSTLAMFTLMRQWVMGNTEVSMFRTFYQTFKRELFTSNLVGLLLAAGTLLTYLNFNYCLHHRLPLTYLILIPTITISISLSIVLLYIFPVMSHFQGTPISHVWNALFFGLRHPIRSAGLLLVVAFFVSVFRGVIPFLSISLVALFITRTVYPCFITAPSNQLIDPNEL